jgi:hypothetical protein
MNISLTDCQKCCKKLHAMTLALKHLGSVYETSAAGETDCTDISSIDICATNCFPPHNKPPIISVAQHVVENYLLLI